MRQNPDRQTPERLSTQLKRIADRCVSEEVSVVELLNTIKGSPYLFLSALFSLIFIPPLPLFWLAPLAALVIALVSLQMILGLRGLIPRSVLSLKLPRRIFPTILKATGWLLQKMEYISRPRWLPLTESPILLHLYGFIMLLSAIVLFPPFPIPFWHLLPSLTIFLLSIGLIEQDGLFIVLAILSFMAMLLTLWFLFFYAPHKLLFYWHKYIG